MFYKFDEFKGVGVHKSKSLFSNDYKWERMSYMDQESMTLSFVSLINEIRLYETTNFDLTFVLMDFTHQILQNKYPLSYLASDNRT